MADTSRPADIHLLRVRVKTRLFQQLQETAHRESAQNDRHTTVSDIVRSALIDWLRANGKPPEVRRFRESGVASPPMVPARLPDILEEEDEEAALPPRPLGDLVFEEEAAMLVAKELLRSLDHSFDDQSVTPGVGDV
jgi:hypothetical protein